MFRSEHGENSAYNMLVGFSPVFGFEHRTEVQKKLIFIESSHKKIHFTMFGSEHGENSAYNI